MDRSEEPRSYQTLKRNLALSCPSWLPCWFFFSSVLNLYSPEDDMNLFFCCLNLNKFGPKVYVTSKPSV